jgi:ABC-type Fe3+ transport system permease subunit
MITPFTTPSDIDPQSVLTITIESFIFGLIGIIIGSIIDKQFKILSDKKNNKIKILLSMLQIILSGLIIGIMYVYISPSFTDHFQRTLAGIAFPALFYGVQSNIYIPWQE